jgi:hypothetical protein
MPFTVGTKPIVPSQNVAKKQKKAEKRAKEKKEGELYKRRKESEALLFGSELFEPIVKKEKEIIIQFPETCTDEGIYISKCGKFGYRKASSDFYFDLFYFISPILEFEASLLVTPSDEVWLFDNITPEELEDLAIKLKRAEYAEEKKKALEEIKRIEKERREELDRVDAEFEAQQEKEEQMKLIKEPIGAEFVGQDYATMDAILTEKLMNSKELKDMQDAANKVAKPIEAEVIKPAFVPLIVKKVDKL